jgi:hypothetical protein
MERCRRRTGQSIIFTAMVVMTAAIQGTVRGQQATAKRASAPFTAEQVRFFEEKVRPILVSRCFKCHGGSGKVKGGLRLDSREAILKGGELGPAVDDGHTEQSLLLQAIRYEELEMPPGGKLPAGEQAILARWVKDDLPWSAQPAAAMAAPALALTPTGSAAAAVAGARHAWSHQPVLRPPVPAVKDRGWVRSPIDAFVLARLEAERLRPAPEADRVTLIRRLTFGLTGLPPSPEDVDAYLADQTPGAYERLVERLLASPHYGEHWARHWLDLVRYGETNGYERDSAKPFAWRYRDYVIDAFNQDKPYDQFVREQLAGDGASPTSAEALIATGFYRLGLWDDEPSDRPLARYDDLDGVVSTTGQVFLGMTINCARCHDHKVDPIPQSDYYRLLAFFIDVTDQDGKNLRKLDVASGSRLDVMCVAERGLARAHVLLRGNPSMLGPKVGPGVPEVLGGGSLAFAGNHGKRRTLADWLTDPHNPRTARVLANRLWQYHFGRGIVPTPNDFGKLGEPATHPELLDWLAAELISGGWRIKPMHRLIVLSSAYRMSSRATSAELGADPSNRWFWRFPMRRLTAEEVRDAMLAISGELRLKTHGPSICPPIPREVLAGQSVPGKGWDVSPPDEASRRSVYIHVKRSLIVPILATHDAADTDSSCPVRYTTTVPTQALGLLNGAFANEQAAHLANRLRREAPGDTSGQVRRATRLTTGREPSSDELRRDVDFIRTLRDRAGLDERDALTQYALLALNANAFFYLD